MTDRIARIVADADVLAADLLVGGSAREALDTIRSHAWITLVASESLLDDAEVVIADVADVDLAREWRATIQKRVTVVDHPPGDHPGLASAYHGDAGHLLTFAEHLHGAGTGTAIKQYAAVSVKSPTAFLHTFDAEIAYEVCFEEPYPGPDRDPRA